MHMRAPLRSRPELLPGRFSRQNGAATADTAADSTADAPVTAVLTHAIPSIQRTIPKR
jgi:hypothetical protein